MNNYSGLRYQEKQVAKKAACDARTAAAAKRTPGQQLARLDAKFGKDADGNGLGATKERAKLQKRIDAAHQAALEKSKTSRPSLAAEVAAALVESARKMKRAPGLDSPEGREMRQVARDKREGKGKKSKKQIRAERRKAAVDQQVV